MPDKNHRIELGAEFLAACSNSVQAAESWAFACQGKGAYPLDKVLGRSIPQRIHRILAAIFAIFYTISAVGETCKVLEDVAGEPS